jgi:hypothetical protein
MAAAAPPVTPAPASFLPDTLNPIPGTCDAYNGAIATGAQNPGGPLHHGACRYGDLSLLINGRPAATFWQAVQAGSVPPPFQPAVTTSLFNTCVTALGLSLHLSANVQTAMLNWTNAPVPPAKPFCAAEWAQHNPASLVANNVVQATTANFLNKAAAELDLTLARSVPPRVCFQGFANAAGIHHAMLQIAGQYAVLFANPIMLINKRWSGVAATSTCAMQCGLCASGWVGKITEQKALTANGQTYYNETQTWYIGGQAPNQPANDITIPAQWTAQGSGAYNFPDGSSRNWNTNATIAGFCPPNEVVCIAAITQGSTIGFSETNNPLNLNNLATVTQTDSSGHSTTSPGVVAEDSINGLAPHITVQASDLPTPPPGGRMVTQCERPTLSIGSSTCTATWTWQLTLQ